MTGVPGVVAVVRVQDIDVVFVAMHLVNGPRGEGQRLKHLLRALGIAAGMSCNLVVLGDLNIGDAELSKVSRQQLLQYGLSEAPYGLFFLASAGESLFGRGRLCAAYSGAL